ncbi:transcriptional regulator [Bacteroidales bacterium]|nr:transcriptional regulator [Bacteroidales bacterium]
MKFNITTLNKVFDNRIRIGVMSALIMNTSLSFKELKEFLDLTDGNLASHLKNLENNDYILVNKGFLGRKTNTTYTLTEVGKLAFQKHIENLESLINKMK